MHMNPYSAYTIYGKSSLSHLELEVAIYLCVTAILILMIMTWLLYRKDTE